MIYRPSTGAMWDPSILFHEGRYHAVMMYNRGGSDGLAAGHCLLATSPDGVHWGDEAIVVEERERAQGAVHHGPRRGPARPPGHPAILRIAGPATLDLPRKHQSGSALARANGPVGPHVHHPEGEGSSARRLLGLSRGHRPARAPTGGGNEPVTGRSFM